MMRSSASIAARSAAVARWRRDLYVPAGIPRASEASASRRESHSGARRGRSAGRAVRRRNPRSIWSRASRRCRSLVSIGEADCIDADFDTPASADARGLLVASPDEDPIEPPFEARGVAERADVEPGPHERVLSGVTSLLVVAQDQSGRPIQARDRPRRECREGIVVAGLCTRDQKEIHSVDCSS